MTATPTRSPSPGSPRGGNLAIEVALHVRHTSLPQPTYELLIYPVASGDLTQESDLLYTSPLLPLSTAALPYFFKFYNPNGVTNQDIQPIVANLKGLPPTTIIAAQFDPLVSDGIQLRDKLTTAGVQTTYRFYTGVTHEFFGLGAEVAKSKQAELDGAADVAAAFAAAK